MRSFDSLRAAGFLAAVVLCAPGVLAQTVTGSVSGTVFDPSNAVVPNATVTAVDTATGVRTTAVSNAAGVYAIRFLPIGQYQVEVSAPGFSKLTVPAFSLEIDQTAKIDAHVTLGGASTSVQVQGEVAPILNTTDGTIGLSFSSKQIETIPLNGRNFSSVTLFQPGAVDTDPTGLVGTNATERNATATGVVPVNGNRAQANNYTLDGVDLNEGQNNLIGYNPAPDAIQEIRVISADAPASYGNGNGGDVVSILKSGTNQFHGSAYGYLENQNLNANSFANKYRPPILPINPFTQSQFGGTIGGPIKRDKLFFFVDYEGFRQHTGGTGTASVFTAAQRQGDFSALPQHLFDTQNNLAPYANNQVPIVNPVAIFLFAHPELYPLPNRTPQDGLVQNDYSGFTRSFHVNNQGDVKIEWDPRTQDKITGFYSQATGSDASTAVLPVTFPSENVFPTKLFGATWVHTFSPTIVNEARIGFLRVRWDQGVPTDPSGLFGLRGNAVVGIPFGRQAYPGFSFQSIQDNFSGVGTTAAPQILRDNTFYYGDNFTWQKGKHLISLGVQAIRYQQNYALTGAQGSLGQFNFNGTFTGDGNGGAGYSGADFVLDRADAENIALTGGGLVGNRQWRTAEFAQDTWKATDRLSLTFGLRYEYDQPWYEVNDKTANVLLTGPQAGTVEYAGHVPTGAPAGSIVCSNRGCYKPTYNQFQPRLGFAYQATPRWVVRGGYGATSFFEGNSNNQRLTYQTPFLAAATVSATTPTLASGSSPYNPGAPLAVTNGFSVNNISNQGAGFGAWPQNIQPAYVHQFNLTTEYALTNSLSFSAAYLGETGQHIEDYRNGNQLTLGQATDIQSLPSGVAIPAADAAPYANLVGQGGALLVTESEAGFNFNAAEVTVRQRGSNGFTWTVNYTYGKALTNSSGNYAQFINVNGPDGAYQDAYNPRADYGPEGTDIRHNLSANGVYQVPFGRGRAHGGTANRALDLVLGGWSLSSSVVGYSGFAETINGPQNSNTNSFGSARANHYRPLKIVNRSVSRWFGTDPSATPCTGTDNGICAYGVSNPNSFGTASVGSERGPGYYQIDSSGFKDFHITERQSVGFRADAFNLFNTANYSNPDTNVTDSNPAQANNSNFGLINNTRSLSRIIQLSAHYTF
jgi:hypothetical protein